MLESSLPLWGTVAASACGVWACRLFCEDFQRSVITPLLAIALVTTGLIAKVNQLFAEALEQVERRNPYFWMYPANS